LHQYAAPPSCWPSTSLCNLPHQPPPRAGATPPHHDPLHPPLGVGLAQLSGPLGSRKCHLFRAWRPWMRCSRAHICKVREVRALMKGKVGGSQPGAPARARAQPNRPYLQLLYPACTSTHTPLPVQQADLQVGRTGCPAALAAGGSGGSSIGQPVGPLPSLPSFSRSRRPSPFAFPSYNLSHHAAQPRAGISTSGNKGSHLLCPQLTKAKRGGLHARPGPSPGQSPGGISQTDDLTYWHVGCPEQPV
jgi:hypothetical protein